MVHLDQAGAGIERVRVMPETGDLAAFIEYFWVEDFDRSAPQQDAASWRIVPDPSAHVIFHAVARGDDRLSVVGARSRFADIDKRGRTLTVGARLRPGALPRITADAATHFTDRSVPLDAVDPAAACLSDRLSESTRRRPEQAAAVLRSGLARYFSGRTSAAFELASGAAAALADGPTRRIHEVSATVGLAPRALRRIMSEQVGIGAKRFARILRVLQTVELAQQRTGTWLDHALASGFVDQPHMTNDFTELLGESPRRFLARAAAQREPAASA